MGQAARVKTQAGMPLGSVSTGGDANSLNILS
jgi:hypothetical protein